MGNRVKYPLTEGARQGARWLVTQWVSQSLPQLFEISMEPGFVSVVGRRPDDPVNKGIPSRAIFLELELFKLVSIRHIPRELPEPRPDRRDIHSYYEWWEILLLDELRNAVEHDFDVSDYFLTTMAVGTVISLDGGGMLSFNGPFQSAASISGNITQTVGQLADQLTETLGESLLESNAEIKAAIDELRKADESNRVSRVGRVIEELGRYMGHVSNAAGVIAAIHMLAQFLR